MADFYNSQFVTTRKPHQCWGCAETFPPGTRMDLTAGVFQGDFHSAYYCEDCSNYATNNPECFENGIGLGDVKTAMEEETRQ